MANPPVGFRSTVQSGLTVGRPDPHSRPSTAIVPVQWVSSTHRLSSAPSTWTWVVKPTPPSSLAIAMSERSPVSLKVTP